MAAAAAAAAEAWDEEESEICNEDGFVYKRRKRRKLSEQEDGPPPQQQSSSAAAPDPEAERRNRRARKKACLVSIREKYRKEMEQWEVFSASVQDLLATARTAATPVQSSPCALPADYSAFRPPIDELLLQVEVQEAVIQKLYHVCDTVESMCNAHEEAAARPLMDLPVWAASPRTLLTSLSE